MIKSSIMSSDDNNPILDSSELNEILSKTLPLSFYNHITMENTNVNPDMFFSPSQQFIMKQIQKILVDLRGKPIFPNVLYYFAKRLMLSLTPDTSLFLFCGEISGNNGKKVGILKPNKKVDIYKKDGFNPKQTISLKNVHSQEKMWEMTKVEAENDIYSPFIAVFRSFSALNKCQTLPIAAYSGFIDYITSADMTIVNHLLKQEIAGIEEPLIQIFMFKNCHRRLLKFCIYEDVFTTDDPNQLMRKNTIEMRIVVQFLTSQIQPLINTYINPIKVNICNIAHNQFDIENGNDPNIKAAIDAFMNDFINTIPAFSSAIKFVLNCIFHSCEARFHNHGIKGIFMAFFFRVIFPLLCQPQPSDPAGIEVDIKNMAIFGKIMTYIFTANQQGKTLSHLSPLRDEQQDNISRLLTSLIDCTESFDAIHCPSMTDACQMVDELRRMCQNSAATLTFSAAKPSQILLQWLNSIAQINNTNSDFSQ